MSLLGIILTFSLVDNIVLSRLLGICPCVGAPGGMRATVSTSAATALLMSLSALAAWALESFILGPLGLEFLRTPAFVLSVAGHCPACLTSAPVARCRSSCEPPASPLPGLPSTAPPSELF